jgi:hypothetical protein
MRFRTLALALLLGLGLTAGAEARKKTVLARPKSHVVKVKKFKGHKLKRPKAKKSARHIRHNS